MSDIFIAYSRTDSAVACQLAKRLRTKGWSFFMDVRTPVGERWDKKIEKELHAARAVAVLWSARSRESDFVLEEAEYGRRKKILFPAFIEPVEFPYGFGRIQAAELVGWAGEDHPGLAQLVESLKEHLKSGEATPEPGDVPHVITSNRVQSTQARVLAPGQTFRDPLKTWGDGPLMVVIPAGRFRMGDEQEWEDDEDPQHDVHIAAPFAMGVYAVTFEDYDIFCESSKCGKPEDSGWGRTRRPVINVFWEEARAYCAWLSEQTGRAYWLPSEMEWEYACRAGTETPFHFGTRINADLANFDGNYTDNGSAKGEYRKQTVPVGCFPPNAFGLYDMHGNVWEWCQGTWHDNYEDAPSDDSAWEDREQGSRVLRGGSWDHLPRLCRVAYRYDYDPDFSIGFPPVSVASASGFVSVVRPPSNSWPLCRESLIRPLGTPQLKLAS